MKKTFIKIWLFLFFVFALNAADTNKGENTLKALSLLYPTIGHNYSSLYPGIGMLSSGDYLTFLGANIHLGASYYLEACLGGGKAPVDKSTLSFVSMGLGLYDEFKNQEDLFYSLGLSIRNFNALSFDSPTLMLELMVEQKFMATYLGLGLELISQDYEFYDEGYFSVQSDRIYHMAFIAYLRSTPINLRACAAAGSISFTCSWTLNMEKAI